MERSRKMFSWIALGVLMISNVSTPWTYAEDEDIEVPELSDVEEMVENNEDSVVQESSFEDSVVQEPSFEELDKDKTISIDNRNITNLNNSEVLNTFSTNNFNDCAETINDGKYLIKYNCGGDITIPDSIERILGDNVFEGQIITGFHIPGGILLSSSSMFSGAIFDGEITIDIDDEHNYNQYTFDHLIIGEHGKLTINGNKIKTNFMNGIKIREGGELIMDYNLETCSFYDILSNSEINGKVSINGCEIKNSIERTFFGENSQIIIGDKVPRIGIDTFYESNIQGEIIFSEGLVEIDHGFDGGSKGVIISKGLKLPKSLKTIKYSFGHSNISGDIVYSGENLDIIGSFGDKSSITGNVIITGASLSLKTSSFGGQTKINGSFICSECLIRNRASCAFDGSEIEGDFIIENDENSIFFGNGSITPKRIGGNVILSGTSFGCQNVFNNTLISGELKIIGKESLSLGSACFYGAEIGKSVVLSGENIEIKNEVFSQGIINSGLVINSAKNFTGQGGSLRYLNVNGNIIISGDSVFLQQSTFDGSTGNNFSIIANTFTGTNGALNQIVIEGKVELSGNNIYIDNGTFNDSNIGNLKINSKYFTGVGTYGIFSGLNIEDDIEIFGDEIYLTGAFTNVGVGGDLKIDSDNIDLQSGSFENLNTSGDIILSGDNLLLDYASLDSVNVGENLYLPKGVRIGAYGALNNIIVHGNVILGGAETILPPFTIGGDLIVEDGNNATSEIFTGINVGSKKVYLSGELSNIGTKAYSFKQGTRIINTIILSDDFENSNIGDGAFCIQNEPEIKVEAVTTKKFTQEEKQDLYDRTCINLTYSGFYNLTLNIDGETIVFKYNGNNIDEMPVPTKNGYKFLGWYEENSETPFDFENMSVTEDKIFYAKWEANTYNISFDAGNEGTNPKNITVTYDSQYPELPIVNKTGYTFSGWYNGEEIVNSGDIVRITEDTTLIAKRTINQYKIIFDTDGGNEINPIEKDYNSVINITLPTPTKECNEFSGWDIELPETMPAHDITLKAIWNYTCSRSSGGGGGAKKSETTTREVAVETPTEKEHNSATEENKTETPITTPSNDETSNQVISVTQEVSEDGTVEAVVETIKIKNTDIVATVRTEVNPTNSSSSSSSSATHTKEQNDAYSFAKSNGITTTESIEEAKMNTELTRIQMAKMLSNFAINVLGQEPDPEKGIVKFDDVTNKMDKQYDNAVTKAYQLGIMGQNVKNNEFRPNDTVTRAEFASALSRLLYDTEEGEYKGTGKYYVPHIAKLYNEGIINKADSNIKEKRGYVMTMLKRTVD